MDHLFSIFFAGLESVAGVTPKTLGFCHFGDLCDFGIFSGDAATIFEDRDHSGKL